MARKGPAKCLKTPENTRKKGTPEILKSHQGYKDSNLEMTESESVALPFGDSPKLKCCPAY